jgi:LCP family protein required for cell wall assembly
MSTPMVRRPGIPSLYGAVPNDIEDRQYTLYRARPRGLRARLRGEEPVDFRGGGHGAPVGPGGGRSGPAGPARRGRRPRLRGRGRRRPITPRRVIKWLVLAVLGWILLSLVLFIISAQIEQGNLPSSATAALSSGSNMLFGADTILILGTDQRPRTGPGSKEPGSNYNDAGSRSDTIMLWRVGGGVSRRLSIPRDTIADIPGYGQDKINSAYAYGGPALAIKTIERFTGIKINHVIVVNLAAFVPFIDAIGGIDVRTGRVCSDISGGTRNGGFSLYLSPGVHHLSGLQALVYARTRENKCNPQDSDLTRVQHQQEILNAIKSKLLSPSIFFRLPIASWDAPKVLRTDMGGFTLLSLFAASEIGGSAPVSVLPVSPLGTSDLYASPAEIHSAVNTLLNG